MTTALDTNFLSSMDYVEVNDEVKAGALIYKNINTLAADYDKRMKDYKNEKRHADQMKAWSTAITVGAYIATAGKPLLAKKMGALIWNGLDISEDNGKKLVDGIIYSGNAVGKYTDYYAGRLKEEAKMPGMPSVIQGEMSLRGTLTDHDRTIRTEFGNPGSLNTNTFDEINTPKYPFYNEHLGVFALFEQPKIQIFYKFTDQVQYEYIQNGEDPAFQIPLEKITDRHQIGLRLENDIKYRINPATNPNMENTKVLFSLRMKHQVPKNANYAENLNFEIRKVIDLPQGKEIYYQTPYLPASCFEKLITSIDFTSISSNSIDQEPAISRGRHAIMPSDIEVSVMVVLESNELSKDNEPNRSVHMFTYPATSTILSGEQFDYEQFVLGYNTYRYNISAKYDEVLNYNSKTISSSNNIYAQNVITFDNGQMNVVAGSSKYEAGNTIEINGNYEIVSTGGEVLFQIYDLEDSPPPCSYDNTGHIIDKTDVERFCKAELDNKYKGNQLSKTALELVEKTKHKEIKPSLRIYPNPAQQYVNISSTLSIIDNIQIYDINGRLVYEKSLSLSGLNTSQIDISTFNDGLYFVKASTSDSIISEKFIKSTR